MPSEPPPLPTSLARLTVAAGAHAHLSAAQKKFNRLLAQVGRLEELLRELQRRADALRAPHLQRMDELRARVQQAQRAMAHFLHARLQAPGLDAAQRRSIRALLRELVAAAPEPAGDAERQAWRALRAGYAPPPPTAEQRRERLQEAIEQVQEITGQRLDMAGLENIESPEQLLAALLEREQARRENVAERRAERRARRAPGARQQREHEREQDARGALRGIYRQLASALHPDRAPDAAELERKHVLMSQANSAHERGDLLALLRLQLRAEQLDEAAIACLSEERLASLSLLLQRQVGALDKELAERQARLAHELGAPLSARDAPEVLGGRLRELQQRTQALAESMEDDLLRVQRDAQLKSWLRAQAQRARERAPVQEIDPFGPLW